MSSPKAYKLMSDVCRVVNCYDAIAHVSAILSVFKQRFKVFQICKKHEQFSQY